MGIVGLRPFYSIAKWCYRISKFLTIYYNSPGLYVLTLSIIFRKNNLFLALQAIQANSNESYSRYNFQAFANISGNFRKISGDIKFPVNLQP